MELLNSKYCWAFCSNFKEYALQMANLFVKLLLCTISQKFSYSLKFFKFLFVFIFGYAAVHRLSLVAARRAIFSSRCLGFSLGWLLSLQGTDSRLVGFSSCMGFSLGWLLSLQSTDSRLVGFSSCSTQALEHGHRLSCSAACGIFPD